MKTFIETAKRPQCLTANKEEMRTPAGHSWPWRSVKVNSNSLQVIKTKKHSANTTAQSVTKARVSHDDGV